jgi:hypothetical protein
VRDLLGATVDAVVVVEHCGGVVVPEVGLDEIGCILRLDGQVALPEVVIGARDDQWRDGALAEPSRAMGRGIGFRARVPLLAPGLVDCVDDRPVLDPPQQQRILRRLSVLGGDDDRRRGLEAGLVDRIDHPLQLGVDEVERAPDSSGPGVVVPGK